MRLHCAHFAINKPRRRKCYPLVAVQLTIAMRSHSKEVRFACLPLAQRGHSGHLNVFTADTSTPSLFEGSLFKGYAGPKRFQSKVLIGHLKREEKQRIERNMSQNSIMSMFIRTQNCSLLTVSYGCYTPLSSLIPVCYFFFGQSTNKVSPGGSSRHSHPVVRFRSAAQLVSSLINGCTTFTEQRDRHTSHSHRRQTRQPRARWHAQRNPPVSSPSCSSHSFKSEYQRLCPVQADHQHGRSNSEPH